MTNNSSNTYIIKNKSIASMIEVYKLIIRGESIREYVNTIRLERACELLDDTDFTVKSIAEMVGFISCNHFFMSFKRKYGMTPQKYRMKAS